MLRGPASISFFHNHAQSFDFKKMQQESESVAKVIKTIRRLSQTHLSQTNAHRSVADEGCVVKEAITSTVTPCFDSPLEKANTAEKKYNDKRRSAPEFSTIEKKNIAACVMATLSARDAGALHDALKILASSKTSAYRSHVHQRISQGISQHLSPLQAQLGALNLRAMDEDVQAAAQLGVPNAHIGGKHFTAFQKREEMRNALKIDIPLQGQHMPHAQERSTLLDTIHAFLDSEKTVFLLLGEAGSGKSTFNRHLTHTLWKEYIGHAAPHAPIPLFIPIDQYDSSLDWVESYLHDQKLPQTTIDALRTENRFIFIIEGLDAVRNPAYRLGVHQVLDRWNAKLIISARPGYIEKVYVRSLQHQGQAGCLQTCYLAPLSDEWIDAYIEKYVQNVQPPYWSTARYKQTFKNAPLLSTALRSPTLLHMALEVLPQCNTLPTTVVALYDQWIMHWWTGSPARLQGIAFTPEENAVLSQPLPSLITKTAYASQRMAIALTKERAMQAFYDAKQGALFPAAWQRYFAEDAEKRVLRFNMPILRQGEHYRFMRPGLQEYFIASAICGPQCQILTSYESAVLNEFSLVDELLILDLLVDRARQFPAFKAHLYDWIEASKTNAKLGVGAANAMTILVRMGNPFTWDDLQNIHIPGADLRYGLFDHADFRGADLRNTRLEGIWLRNARLDAARLEGAQWNALPVLAQEGPAKTAIYSPNGAYFVVGVEGNALQNKGATICLYQTFNWKRIHSFTLESAHITTSCVTFSADNECLAVVDTGGVVRRWEIPLGRELTPLKVGKAERIGLIAFSPNAPLLAVQAKDAQGWGITLWDTRAQAKLYAFKKQSHPARAVTFAPNGAWLAIAGLGKQGVQLWDLHTQKMLCALVCASPCSSIAFSPDSRQLALGEANNRLSLWNIASRERLWTTPFAGAGAQVVFSPDSQYIAAVSAEGEKNQDDEYGVVRLWHVASGTVFHQHKGHTDAISAIAFSPDGNQFATSGIDQTVRLWKVPMPQAQRNAIAHTQAVSSMAFSPDGSLLATCGNEGAICLWEMPSGQLAHRLKRDPVGAGPSGVQTVHFSPHGQWLAVRGVQGSVELYQVQSDPARLIRAPHLLAQPAQDTVFSPDGTKIIHKNGDCLGVWDIQNQKQQKTGDIPGLHRLVFTKVKERQRLCAVCINDGEVSLRDISANTVMHTLGRRHFSSRALDAIYTPYSQSLAISHADHTVTVWGVHSQKKVTLQGHTHRIQHMAFSPDGAWLATNSDDRTLRLWTTASGKCIEVIRLGNTSIQSMAWHSDEEGIYLATGSDDAIVRLWQVQSPTSPHKSTEPISNALAEASSVVLWWASSQTQLVANGVVLEKVQGLSPTNRTALVQQGALLRERDRVTSMQGKPNHAAPACIVM